MATNNGRASAIPQSACNILSSAVAYSLNVTVVPNGFLITSSWPVGQNGLCGSSFHYFRSEICRKTRVRDADYTDKWTPLTC